MTVKSDNPNVKGIKHMAFAVSDAETLAPFLKEERIAVGGPTIGNDHTFRFIGLHPCLDGQRFAGGGQ